MYAVVIQGSKMQKKLSDGDYSNLPALYSEKGEAVKVINKSKSPGRLMIIPITRKQHG